MHSIFSATFVGIKVIANFFGFFLLFQFIKSLMPSLKNATTSSNYHHHLKPGQLQEVFKICQAFLRFWSELLMGLMSPFKCQKRMILASATERAGPAWTAPFFLTIEITYCLLTPSALVHVMIHAAYGTLDSSKSMTLMVHFHSQVRW